MTRSELSTSQKHTMITEGAGEKKSVFQLSPELDSTFCIQQISWHWERCMSLTKQQRTVVIS